VMKNKIASSQTLPFALSFCIFITVAVFGWIKLRYGFNFIDEGYHMTEAWRLIAGDDFFRDKFTGALTSSTLINFLVFKIYPGITLLGFRKLQFCLTVFSLLVLSFALYTVNKQFWFQPLIFSVFAFTGLDPVGMISNLYYQTYPNLFITLYLGLFIIGLNQKSLLVKRVLYILSGVCLWLISFSLLHMSLVALSPIVLFALIKRLKIRTLEFSFEDLCFVLAPFALCWAVFLGIFQMAYIRNVFSSIQLMLSTTSHAAGSLITINWEALKYSSITILFILAFLYSTNLNGIVPLVGALLILSVLMYAIIDTSLFGLIRPYQSIFDHPMWFAALLISSYFLISCYFLFKVFSKKPWGKLEQLALIMIIPVIIMAVSSSIFSTLGVLSVLHSSIPAISAITCLILSFSTINKRSYLEKFMVLLLFLAPFYYTTAWYDWKFTFFDVTPEVANVVIDDGFGKGIRTNQTYKDLYAWIHTTSEKYSRKDDYIISYIGSPMVHMIARRRPALDDPFISFAEVPLDYYKEAIDLMKQDKRDPRLAYVFEGMPALEPISLKENRFKWFTNAFSFPSNDPISQYVLANMYFLAQYKIHDDVYVRCFTSNKADAETMRLSREIINNPSNGTLYYQLGNVYLDKNDLNKAIVNYQKALDLIPDFIQALHQLAVVNALKGNYDEAIKFFNRIIALKRDNADEYYNIACVYAKQVKIEESMDYLKKALGRGFNNWELLMNYKDLSNIRQMPQYQELLKAHHEKSKSQ